MAFDYLRILPYRRRIKRLIARTAAGETKPVRGITVVGPFARAASISKVLRDFVRSLKDAGVPFQTLDTDPRRQVPHSDTDGILTPIEEFDVRRYDHVVEILMSIVPDIDGIDKARIVFWEFADGLASGYPYLLDVRHIIAMSNFCAEACRRELPKVKVTKVLYPFRFAPGNVPESVEIRHRFGIPKDAFMVFFNFDYGSGFGRKNPDGALRAFAKAFTGAKDAVLVFKTMGAKSHPDRVASLMQLAEDLGVADRFVSIDTYVPERELYGLSNACDVYLSLHRGEGFGLTLVEAMAMGKPVVCTDWSSTTEFCNPKCTIPIACKVRAVEKGMLDNPAYNGVSGWAEADADAAIMALKRLYEDRSLCHAIGDAARVSIRSQFSIENFRRSIMSFLEGA